MDETEERERWVRIRAVAVLCTLRGWKQADLAAVLGVSPTLVSQWEKGRKVPEPETLERIAEVAGFPRGLLRRQLAELRGVWAALVGPTRDPVTSFESGIDDLAAEHGRIQEELFRSFWRRILAEEAAAEAAAVPPPADPDDLWARLQRYPDREDQKALIEAVPEFRGPAFCARLGAESEKALPENPGQAAHLAGLALLAASLAPGTPAERARRQSEAPTSGR